MNQTQRNYALERINRVQETISDIINGKHTTPAKILSPEERLTEFKKGNYTVKKGVTTISGYTDLVNVVKFKAETPKKFDRKGADRKINTLVKKLNVLRDDVMLGDKNVALEALKTLERIIKNYE